MPETLNMDLQARLPDLLPVAIHWAETQAAAAAEQGQRLTPALINVARWVGVKSPQRIRVMLVDAMPQPREPLLRKAAASAGFLGPDTAGLTLGYAIFVRRGHDSLRLMSHECRHVHQYENLGSIGGFLPVYLQQLLTHGYRDAPLEIDARAHEIESA